MNFGNFEGLRDNEAHQGAVEALADLLRRQRAGEAVDQQRLEALSKEVSDGGREEEEEIEGEEL